MFSLFGSPGPPTINIVARLISLGLSELYSLVSATISALLALMMSGVAAGVNFGTSRRFGTSAFAFCLWQQRIKQVKFTHVNKMRQGCFMETMFMETDCVKVLDYR